MKLNTKRTFLVGLAFLSICAFWQLYDNVMPLILDETFHIDKTFSGAIMAADNVLALFLLPFFGALSDKTRSPIGKRMPYILVGTITAIVLMNLLPVFDNSYFAEAKTVKMIVFVVLLGLLLVAMGIYRSPAVALMPDITPKPLRSRANAIINLMGAIGGALYLLLTAILYPKSKTEGAEHVDYAPLFLIVAGIMLISVGALLIFINENKLTSENKKLEDAHPEWNLAVKNDAGSEILPKPIKKSLAFLLASIALWYIGYNAVSTWFTVYVSHEMGEKIGGASTCLLVGTVGAIVSYIPIGMLAAKIGRKKVILMGTLVLAGAFGTAFLLTMNANAISPVMYALFALVGFAWAAINVNSLPMVVEMCKGSDIGKFTGYYYTASMLAQVVTPILSGFLLEHVSYKTLFPYAAFFVLTSTVTMLFVRHGDVNPEAKKGLEVYEEMDN